MFRPLIGHHQVIRNLWGDYTLGVVFYLGDEISPYNIILGVKAVSRHVKVFLRMNTWMFETCRRHYNRYNVFILSVLIT